jgi:oligopeptide/dipeptide ABC transporter ATP-binding protein
LADLPAGCRFHPRCDFAEARCRTGNPLPEPATATHATACIRWREVMLGEAVVAT